MIKVFENIDFAQYRHILVQIHIPGHWLLGSIDLENKLISYCDSMDKNSSKAESLLSPLLEIMDTLVPRSFSINKINKSFQQTDGSSCGIFLMANALAIASKKSVQMTQAEASVARTIFRAELIEGKLI